VLLLVDVLNISVIDYSFIQTGCKGIYFMKIWSLISNFLILIWQMALKML